jgi:tRNA pseudouridine65 synthase
VRDELLPVPTAAAKPARTRYVRLATVELPHRVDRYPTSRYAMLRLSPLSGRRHQLRRHLAHISHPIAGDSTYGNGRHNRLIAQLTGVRRLLLACVELGFSHPVTGAPLRIRAPLDAEFTAVLETLGLTSRCPGLVNRGRSNARTVTGPRRGHF